MIVEAIYNKYSDLNIDLKKIFGFISHGTEALTVGEKYEVYAISIFERTPCFQIIDDNHSPTWTPIYFFKITDNTMPADWICNFFLMNQAWY